MLKLLRRLLSIFKSPQDDSIEETRWWHTRILQVTHPLWNSRTPTHSQTHTHALVCEWIALSDCVKVLGTKALMREGVGVWKEWSGIVSIFENIQNLGQLLHFLHILKRKTHRRKNTFTSSIFTHNERVAIYRNDGF